MNLADALKPSKPVLPPFPSYNSPLKDFSNMKEFIALNFGGFRSTEVFNGLTIYAGSPDEETVTTDSYVKELEAVYYTVKSDNGSYDEGVDTLLANIHIFISHDGAYLLKKHRELKMKKAFADNEIVLFLEYSSSDVISDEVTLVLAGDKVKKYVAPVLASDYLQDKYFISSGRQKEMVEQVIASNSATDAAMEIILRLQDAVIEKVTEIGVGIFDAIEKFFSETLRIPDSFWNVGDSNSTMKKFGDDIESHLRSINQQVSEFVGKYEAFLPGPLAILFLGIKTIASAALEAFKIVRYIGEFIVALVCGFWNAIMDTIAGIFGLIKLIIQMISGVVKGVNGAVRYIVNRDYYNALVLEYLDNLLREALKIDWKEVLKTAQSEMLEVAALLVDLPNIIFNKITSINHSEAGYYLGYIIFEIVSWLFPPIKIAELGKIAKWTRFDKIRKAAKILPDTPGKGKAANLVDEFLEMIPGLIAKFKEGTGSIKQMLIDVIRNFKHWLDDLLFNVSKTSDEVEELFRKAVKNAKGEANFKRAELTALAKKLEQKYTKHKLKVKVVTPTTKENKLRLKRWDRENVLGSFAPGPPPVIYVRQRCTHLTMQHEVWHLEDYVRLGEKEYRKIVNWKHEESVWLKILDNKKRWTQGELIESYKYYKRTALAEGGVPIIDEELEKLIK